MNKGTVFPHLPFNTERIYVRGICKSGCEIWIPAMSHEHSPILQQTIQEFLDSQPEPEKASA